MNTPKKILHADDDDTLRILVARFLSGIGYEVISAKDADEAISTLRKFRDTISLVITDGRMPNEGDGIAVAEQAAEEGIPAIAFSSTPEDFDTKHLFAAVAKTGSVQPLRAAVSRALSPHVKDTPSTTGVAV